MDFTEFSHLCEATKDNDDPKRRLINKTLERSLEGTKTTRHAAEKGDAAPGLKAPRVKNTMKNKAKKGSPQPIYQRSRAQKSHDQSKLNYTSGLDSAGHPDIEEEVDPVKYHKQLDGESWFYKDQKKRYDKAKKSGKKIEYRIDPERDKAKSESLFTDFLDDLKDPLYEVLGVDNKEPKCPPGYKYDRETLRCVPKTEKDNVNGPGNKKMPNAQNFYNVIGSSGYDGGWAFEEMPTPGTENPTVDGLQ